jgi:hypothetical protein
MMSVDYDASDSPPTTKQQIEDTDPRVDGMPCENINLRLNSRDMHGLYPVLYVRAGGLPGASDIKTFDVGNFNIATQGNQNASEIGELRVRYRCTFSVPVLDSTTSAPANNSVTFASDAGGQAIVTTVPFTAPMASITVNGLNAVNTAGSIVLPAGNYLLDSITEIVDTGIGVITAAEICYLKNGLVIGGTQNNLVLGAAAILTTITLAGTSIFYTSNGTDTLSVRITSTFTTTAQAASSIRIVAI